MFFESRVKMMKFYWLILFANVLCCSSQKCFDCAAFNRKSVVLCAQKSSDCGSCIPGFVEDEVPRIGPCHKLEVTLHPPPKIVADVNEYYEYYNKVDLPCVFSGKVICGWTHDGYRVDFFNTNRFRLEEATETTDCTLTITDVDEFDSGDWQCVALSTTGTELSIKSNKTTVKIYGFWAELITVEERHEVLLTCFSHQPVDCEWWAKKPHYRYEIATLDDDKMQYVDKTEGPKRDCSIRIKYMKEVQTDFSYDWICWAHDKVKSVYKKKASWPAVYFDDVAIGRQTIPIQYYKALDENGTFSCLNSTMSIKFTMYKNCSTNSTLNANSNRVSLKDIENYNQNEWINVTITCGDKYRFTRTVITNDKSFLFTRDISPKCETNFKGVGEQSEKVAESPIILKNVEGEQQQVVKTPIYNMVGTRHQYMCPFHNTHRCLWLKNEKRFHPHQYGYYYYDYINECSIVAKNSSIGQLNNVTCVGYINYNIIYAVLHEYVELDCQSKTNACCRWKRNDTIVSIGGRYSYNLTTSNYCSIRINNVSNVDYGNWTCSYQSTDNQRNEIIAAFTLLSKQSTQSKNATTTQNLVSTEAVSKAITEAVVLSTSSRYKKSSKSPSENPNQTVLIVGYSSKTIIALSVCTAVLILILIGFICHKRYSQKQLSPWQPLNHPEIQLPVLSNTTAPTSNPTEDANGYLIPKPSQDKQQLETSSDDVCEHIQEEIETQ